MPRRSQHAPLYDALTDVELREFYNAWMCGRLSKFEIEEQIGDQWSRGQGITRAWRSRLNIETKGVDWKDLRIAELEEKVSKLEGMMEHYGEF